MKVKVKVMAENKTRDEEEEEEMEGWRVRRDTTSTTNNGVASHQFPSSDALPLHNKILG